MQLYHTSRMHVSIQVPSALRADLVDWARGWISTETNENGIRVVTKGSKANENNVCGRAQRWARLVNSTLFAERKRENVKLSGASKPEAQGLRLNDDMFTASNESESNVDKTHFENILDDRKTFPQLSAEKYHAAGLRWAAYLQAVSFKVLEASWCALMLVPCMVVRNAALNIRGIVVHVSQYFAIVWKVNVISAPHRLCSWVPLPEQEASPYSIIFVNGFGVEWQVLETESVSPARLRTVAELGGRYELCYKLKAGTIPMSVASARLGFPNLTVKWLERLWREAKVL